MKIYRYVLNASQRSVGATRQRHSVKISELQEFQDNVLQKSVDSTGLIVFITSIAFTLIPFFDSFYFFDPYNISCYIQEDVPFVLKFKSVRDIRHFLLL